MNPTASQVKEACAYRFATFCRVMQDDGWFDPKHEELCDMVQKEIEAAIQNGSNPTVNIAVVMARGSLKSTIISKYLPVWLTLEHKKLPYKSANLRALIATNTHPNAKKKLENIRGVFDSNILFRELWSELLPKKSNRWTNEAADINHTDAFPEATFEACGMQTQKTGNHYNLLIEDDTVAPEEHDMSIEVVIPSVEVVEKGIGWHKVATALLVPKGLRLRVVVTTRWADYDLISYIKENEKYALFDLPAVDEEGRPTLQIFYNAEQLKEIEQTVGPYLFAALYKNRPLDASQRVFKPEWMKWEEEVVGEGFCSIAVDPAISDKVDSCETAITKVIHTGSDKRVQHWQEDVHEHLNPSETVNRTLDMAEASEFPVKGIIIETVAYQKALRYMFYDEMTRRNVHYRIIPFDSRQNKELRIYALEPFFASGKIFLVRGLTPQVESQLRQFPNGKLVDIIDSFSMHLILYKKDKGWLTPQRKLEGSDEQFQRDLRKSLRSYKIDPKDLQTGLKDSTEVMWPLDTGLGIERDIAVAWRR